MRLSESERNVIKEALNHHFEATARVFLFGSRIDDHKRGGDIDLYVETELQGEELILAKLRAMSEIQRHIGDQKIDIVTAHADQTGDIPPIIQKARENSIPL